MTNKNKFHKIVFYAANIRNFIIFAKKKVRISSDLRG